MSTSKAEIQKVDPESSIPSDRTSISSKITSDDDDDEWWDEEENTRPSQRRSAEIQVSAWPKPPQGTGLGVSFSRKPDKRYSVQKPTTDKSKGRQRKQNAKAGIKVLTNFSRHQPAASPVQLQHSRGLVQTGSFVDLAALQALDGGNFQLSGGFWKTNKNKELVRTANTMPSLLDSAQATVGVQKVEAQGPHALHRRPANNLHASLPMPSEDLSPNDRPIVIGISIPTADVTNRTLSPQTAASETTNIVRSYQHRPPMTETPNTPTIIITPARQGFIWSPLDGAGIDTYQPFSSNVYLESQVTPVLHIRSSYLENERQQVAAQRSYFSPDSEVATTWDDEDDISRSRVNSSCTMFEEDESPILVRASRAISITDGSKLDRHASTSTHAANRHSKGWWNYITTPFLSRSNTFATRDAGLESPPALPCLTLAAKKAEDAERDDKLWEKQFSPLTPETTTSISSNQHWNADSKHRRFSEQSPILKETRHKAQTSTGTLPLVLSETAGFGSATISSIASQVSNQLTRENTSTSLQSGQNHLSSEASVPNLNGASVSRSLQSNNPLIQPRLSSSNPRGLSNASQPGISRPTEGAISLNNPQPINSPSAGPPPPYSPSPARLRYRAVLPPGHAVGTQYPSSSGPLSPGLQQAMTAGSAIPMSTVPLKPPARRPINLNSGYSEHSLGQSSIHPVGEHYGISSLKPTKAEAKRKRYEIEDSIAHRAGGWWRGRGCIPSSGCYGRNGPEGRKRRRWSLGLVIMLVSVIIIVVALATTLHRKPNTIIEPSQWLNLTGFPPIFLGISTITAPINIRTNTGCVFPATKWSCDLPKELQPLVAPSLSNQPNFVLHIQWDNSSSTNATFANVTGSSKLFIRHAAFNPVTARQLVRRLILNVRQIVTFVPSPTPPSTAEGIFLGNATDGVVSERKAGEPTPFYISFLSSVGSTISKRQLLGNSGKVFPDITSIIPPPSLRSDGTAASANLLPFPSQQPVRLYDRGLPTEHYGFYTYFDRSIFLKSIERLNSSNLDDGEVSADRNGGTQETEAAFRCTWSQTRFLVQMWTRMNASTQLLNSTQHVPSRNPAVDLKQPGSFPYPTSITTDRHGGDPSLKMVYCYEMNSRQGLVAGSGKINAENRAFGGTAFNPAPSFFSNTSDPSLGGFDGGTGGCSCQWSNFRSITRA
ncbi:uncharacterized protein RAG0_15578 [Rhynchosporium agropyri]|uniref:Glycoprotease family protein n=1 Tax=Rhynchosporium agropyri TaxID=914238 RepID=A0A1E1LLR4_9HELO|nr:uncharacterized protein RAG0_15578 [Rhynchosporium agropyri]